MAFDAADRGEFFGTLGLCHEYGIRVKVYRAYADDVLSATEQVGSIVDIDVEPWDTQDCLFKWFFDIGFAEAALLVLSPVILLNAAVIRVEGNGAVFFTQKWTCRFEDTFSVYEFQTLKPEPDSEVETEFEGEAPTWKRRWFVKPVLTGLAHINDGTSQAPVLKIDYDIEYVRCQSFVFDTKIVIRQFWQVADDLARLRKR